MPSAAGGIQQGLVNEASAESQVGIPPIPGDAPLYNGSTLAVDISVENSGRLA
jgi:hypothetical protein